MASKQEDAGMDIRIHPLVVSVDLCALSPALCACHLFTDLGLVLTWTWQVMSVADAHTRNKVQYNQTKAIGALFGVQLGRQVQIYDSVEMAYKEEKGQIELDHKNFEEDVNLCKKRTAIPAKPLMVSAVKEVFPNYECLGWYATGKKLQPFHAELHEQVSALPLLCVATDPRHR